MRGLTAEERHGVECAVGETGITCDGDCQRPELLWTPEEHATFRRLATRGLVSFAKCNGDPKAHVDVTPLGRLALLADDAVRGLITVGAS